QTYRTCGREIASERNTGAGRVERAENLRRFFRARGRRGRGGRYVAVRCTGAVGAVTRLGCRRFDRLRLLRLRAWFGGDEVGFEERAGVPAPGFGAPRTQ